MTSNKLIAASLSVVGLGSAFFMPAAAFASTSCPAGSTSVATGVCEILYTESPSGDFTIPAGVTKIEALIVGAGGYGEGGYGGGGGDVVIYDLETTGSLSIQVGTPGTDVGYVSENDSVVTQGSNSYVAEGGHESDSPALFAGSSGSGYDPNQNYGGGAGANGISTVNEENGGPGFIVNELAPSDSLFADVTDCYGGGGSWAQVYSNGDGTYSLETYFPGCENGGGFGAPEWANLTDANALPNIFVWSDSSDLSATNNVGSFSPAENSGSGGNSLWADALGSGDVPQDGAAGKVVLRFELGGDNTLAATGTTDASNMLTSGVAVGSLIAGAVALTSTRRRKNA